MLLTSQQNIEQQIKKMTEIFRARLQPLYQNFIQQFFDDDDTHPHDAELTKLKGLLLEFMLLLNTNNSQLQVNSKINGYLKSRRYVSQRCY